MQGTPPWYTPPSSALNNDPNSANYFYNYNQWSRPQGNYDSRYYHQHHHHHQNQPPLTNGIRTCGDGYGTLSQQNSVNNNNNNYECPNMYYRQSTVDYDVSRNRKPSQPLPPDSNTPSSFDKMRGGKPPLNAARAANDTEAENFSSVFTQSLTSLYSQDVEANFSEEKVGFGDERNGSVIPCSKIKTEDLSEDCSSEYGYGSMYQESTQNPNVMSYESMKIKPEPYQRDNVSPYDSFSMDDMYMRRRHGTLAEAYSRKRKHSMPTGNYVSPMSSEEKSPRLYQSDSQWIPNAETTCSESPNSTYQRSTFSEPYAGYESGTYNKRQPGKPRAARTRSDNADSKAASSSSKKVPKKVSPLTLYAKVVDDRIMDVTCRRYKKRSKPKTSGESLNDENQSVVCAPMPMTYTPPFWGNLYETVNSTIQDLVDKVCRSVEYQTRRPPDFSSLNPYRAKELIYRFCCEFSLDYRDFMNVEEILNSDVTIVKEEAITRKRKMERTQIKPEEYRKTRRRGNVEESLEKKPEGSPERKEVKTEKKPEKPNDKRKDKHTENKTMCQEENRIEKPEGREQENVAGEMELTAEMCVAKRPEKSIEKKSSKMSDSKLEKIVDRIQEKAIDRKTKESVEKKQELSTENDRDRSLEKSRERSVEKKREIVKEKKRDTSKEKKREISIEKKWDRSVEKVEDLFVAKKHERFVDKKQSQEKKSSDASMQPDETDSKSEEKEEEETKLTKPRGRGGRKPKTPESSEPRVLRSLPSRQPKPVKKTRRRRRHFIRSRYSKRNAKNKKVDEKTDKKLVIDLSREDVQKVDLIESGDDVHPNSDSELEESRKITPDESTKAKETNAFVQEESSAPVVVEKKKSSPTEKLKSPLPVVLVEPSSPAADEVAEDDDEEFGLRQPPQLVRMTDDSNLFHENSSDKEMTLTNGIASGRLSSGLQEASRSSVGSDSAPPPTLQPNETYPLESVDDTNKSKLPKKTAQDEINSLETKQALPILESNAEAIANASEPKDNKGVTVKFPFDDDSEDDCIVVDPDDSLDRPASKLFNYADATSNLKEKLLSKSLLESFEKEDCGDGKSIILPPSLKNITKDEQDESILRALLLESEAASHSHSIKELVASGASVFANVIDTATKETLASLNIDDIKAPDLCSSPLNSLPKELLLDLGASPRLGKFQSFLEGYANNLSPESFENAQKQLDEVKEDDTKEASLLKDPQQLKERIMQLKNEIVCLQVIAEQKEKEKIAIVCFKKYKEELLRRICKAYAFSVQDHVRDWIYSKRENATDGRPGNSSALNLQKSQIMNQKNDILPAMSPTSKVTTSDGFRGVVYPVPTPAHSSPLSHRSRPIHSPHREPSATVTSEKVSAVETLVAKATNNYGLDMTNLRERLRCSPETSGAANILQKVLSSQSIATNSTPDRPFVSRPWSPERKTPSTAMAMCKTSPSPYQDSYGVPLDMMIGSKCSSSSSMDLRTTKAPDIYRSSPEISKTFHGTAEKSQIQSLLAEPVQIKTHRNPYRSWSIQAGGRISDDKSSFTKTAPSISQPIPSSTASSVPDICASPLQRQLASSSKSLPMQNLGMSPMSVKSMDNISNHLPHVPNKREKSTSSSSSASLESIRNKKIEEERRPINYSQTISSITTASTVPYGGHIIRNNTPLATPVPAKKGAVLCMGCGTTDAKFLCSGCRKHWYCSPRCQSIRWPEHSRICAGRMYNPSPRGYS